MKPSEENDLNGKFWNGETSREEEEQLFTEYCANGFAKKEDIYFGFLAQERIDPMMDEGKIWERIKTHERKKKRVFIISTGIAASILIILSLYLVNLPEHTTVDGNEQMALNTFTGYNTAFKIEKGNNPVLYVNGCQTTSDYHATLQSINPKCIQHISLSDGAKGINGKAKRNGKVEVWLKGKSDEIYSICEGTLYFYQDGEMKSIDIDDECSPKLLVDCYQVPISEIKELKPQEIKSIELTCNPRDCNGHLNGEYIVMESK